MVRNKAGVLVPMVGRLHTWEPGTQGKGIGQLAIMKQ